jgi:tetratricopeptide (TPR) repeat protein
VVVQRDYVLVAFMVVVMALSALSIYQATHADHAADDRVGVLRIIEGDAARQAGYLQTVIAHDLSVLTPFCEAETSRRDAMADLLGGTPKSAEIASHTIMTRSLEPLLLGDPLAQCALPPAHSEAASYDVARARQTLEHNHGLGGSAVGTPGQKDPALAAYSTVEQNLMTAALLFALALGLLIAIDMLGRTDARPRELGAGPLTAVRRSALILAGLAALIATTLLVMRTVVLPIDDESRYVTFGVAALLLVIKALSGHRWITPHLFRASSSHPHWWSEVIGAGVIVVFSLAALGLSSVSVLEREANVRADALHASAQQLQQIGEQSALRDLAAVAISARFVAQSAEAAAAHFSDSQGTGSILRDLAVAERELQDQMSGFDATVREQIASSPLAACSGRDRDTDRPRSDPSTLYQELAGEPSNITWHVRQYQEPALACDTAAEIARAEARAWARHGSWLTVTLVLVGLAGFMLSLAADSKREKRVARTLRAAGVLGACTGIVLGAVVIPDLFWRAELPEQAQVPGIAGAIAAARIDPCGEGTVQALDAAIEQYPAFGRTYEMRALANLCTSDWWRLSSDADPASVKSAIKDFEEARRLGATGADLDLNAGWVLILDGIQRDDDLAVRNGLQLTNNAISALERVYPAKGTALAPGTTLHVARFNRALAFAALGEEDQAIAGYRQATQCLAPGAECAGGGLLDPALIDETVLWALADLELLGDPTPEGDDALDPYRLELVDDPDPPRPPGDSAPKPGDSALEDASLNIYAQDADVSADLEPSRATVIWYSRWNDKDTWQVLQVPSHTTMHPGGHFFDRPTALGQCAPAAHYRADVYTGGVRHPVTVEDDKAVAPPPDAIRVSTSRLGLSAIVPMNWTLEDPAKVYRCDDGADRPSVTAIPTAALSDDGRDWHVGPDSDSGLTIRRIEGVVPDENIEEHLQRTLEAWASEARRVEASALLPVPNGYFLGTPYMSVADVVDRHLRVAVAYDPYLWEAPERGGTTFLVALDDRGVAVENNQVDLNWVEEIVLEAPQQEFPKAIAAGNGFELEISAAWSVERAPTAEEDWVLKATPPRTNTALYVYILTDQSDVRATVDDWEENLKKGGGAGWSGVQIESRKEVSVPGADYAESIEYSRDREGSGKWWTWELFASNGQTITNVYVTTWKEDVGNVQSTVEGMMNTLKLTQRPTP